MAGAKNRRRTALVVHVEPKTRGARGLRDAEARLEEAVGLTAAIHLDVVWSGIAPLARPVPATLLGTGKVEEIADKPLKDMNIDELEALWQRAKKLV